MLAGTPPPVIDGFLDTIDKAGRRGPRGLPKPAKSKVLEYSSKGDYKAFRIQAVSHINDLANYYRKTISNRD